jgi:hypothetical protein
MKSKPSDNIGPLRPTLPDGLRSKRLAALRERARKRGVRSIDRCVQLLASVVNDDRYSIKDRTGAANDLLDRFGHPRLSAIANIEEVVLPKLIERREFTPPATFNPNPPSGAEIIDVDMPDEAPPEAASDDDE